ncbi:MAG: glycosyltransferase family 4 protein [Bacteroidales bacterium]|nr:glycosyltransferase family 4 protein [Bacteroidales bacterium]
MRIVYFYQYFTTPKGSYGTRVYEFTKRWVEQGNDVTVVTSVYAKSDIRAEKFIENQEYDGIKLKVINVGVDNRQGKIKRIWSFLQYMLVSCWYALTLKADVVIASSGPITTGFPGLVAHYLCGRKFVFEVRDLWPEVAVDLNVISNKTLVKLAYWFEKRCYKAACHIIALSPGMKNDITRRYGFTHITSVTNSANIELFSTPAPLPSSYGLEAKKYAIYTGNIGMVNNSEWLYRTAKVLKEKNTTNIKIVLVGEGQQRIELEKRKTADHLDNFIFLGSVPKKELVALVQNAFVSLVPLKGNKILDTSSPNKFFESLAAGVPVIQNTGGWMKDFLLEHQIGYTLDPDNEIALADLLSEMVTKPDVLAAMGEKAKTIAAAQFDKNILADKMLNAIKESI